LVKEAQPDNHPLQLLATALGSADRTDLRHILRISYLKAIRTVTELIGDENAMGLDISAKSPSTPQFGDGER